MDMIASGLASTNFVRDRAMKAKDVAEKGAEFSGA
jgi:hypothetical protein